MTFDSKVYIDLDILCFFTFNWLLLLVKNMKLLQLAITRNDLKTFNDSFIFSVTALLCYILWKNLLSTVQVGFCTEISWHGSASRATKETMHGNINIWIQCVMVSHFRIGLITYFCPKFWLLCLIWSCLSFIKYLCSNCQKNSARRVFHTVNEIVTHFDLFCSWFTIWNRARQSNQILAEKYDIQLISKYDTITSCARIGMLPMLSFFLCKWYTQWTKIQRRGCKNISNITLICTK